MHYKEKDLYFRKYCFKEKDNEYIIYLKEKNKVIDKELILESKASLIEKLKVLFENKFLINSLDDIVPNKNKSSKNDDENKNFLDFKKTTIENFKGQFLMNDVPGFLEDQKIFLNNSGLITKEDGTIIDKEKAFIVWKYLFENKHRLGVYTHVNPIKIFIGKVLEKHIDNPIFGTPDVLKYLIDDIKIEDYNKYRLFIKDESGKIEKAKNTLDYKQLVTLVDRKVI